MIQPPTKQLVPEPKPIRVDHVGLTIVGYLLDATGVEIRCRLATVHPVRLARKPHDPAQFFQVDLPAIAKRRQHVAYGDAVVGVPVVIGAVVHARRENPVNHGPVTNTGRSKPEPLKVTNWGDSSPTLLTKDSISCF